MSIFRTLYKKILYMLRHVLIHMINGALDNGNCLSLKHVDVVQTKLQYLSNSIYDKTHVSHR